MNKINFDNPIEIDIEDKTNVLPPITLMFAILVEQANTRIYSSPFFYVSRNTQIYSSHLLMGCETLELLNSYSLIVYSLYNVSIHYVNIFL